MPRLAQRAPHLIGILVMLTLFYLVSPARNMLVEKVRTKFAAMNELKGLDGALGMPETSVVQETVEVTVTRTETVTQTETAALVQVTGPVHPFCPTCGPGDELCTLYG